MNVDMSLIGRETLYIMIFQAAILLSFIPSHIHIGLFRKITRKMNSISSLSALNRKRDTTEKLRRYWEMDMTKFK